MHVSSDYIEITCIGAFILIKCVAISVINEKKYKHCTVTLVHNASQWMPPPVADTLAVICHISLCLPLQIKPHLFTHTHSIHF